MNIQQIIKLCTEEPNYLAKFELDISNSPESQSTSQPKLLIHLLNKIWIGFTKFLHRQINKGNCVHSIYLGKFLPKSNSSKGNKSLFIPSLEFIEKGKFGYKENKHNINPITMIPKVLRIYIYIYI